MILKFELSQKELQALSLGEKEEILYAVPYDMDVSGQYVVNAYTVVTNERLVLLRDAKPEKEYVLADYEAVKAEPRINCGVLYGVKDGQDYLIVRYSAKHLARYAYVARGIVLLKSGSTAESSGKRRHMINIYGGKARRQEAISEKKRKRQYFLARKKRRRQLSLKLFEDAST